MDTSKTDKLRAINLPESEVGRRRQELYREASAQSKSACEHGFFIESIAISESIIADRLEARRQFLNPNDRTKHRFSTLGRLLAELQKEDIY